MASQISELITPASLVWTNDISGKSYVNEMYEGSRTKKWIKPIPFEKAPPLDEYRNLGLFRHVASAVYCDTKKMIRFIPKIPKEEYDKKAEWIYLFVLNGRIVKIGGTRDGLRGRTTSYLCGVHVVENGKSGKASVTNSYVYNTFEFYSKLGCPIEMYGYELPVVQLPPLRILDRENVVITAQTYPAYETVFIEDFTKTYGFQPFLCNNCDPSYLGGGEAPDTKKRTKKSNKKKPEEVKPEESA
jgi:hypothetical protein